MAFSLTLRGQSIVLAAALATGMVGSFILNVTELRSLVASVAALQDTGSMIRKQMKADMRHDTVRGDVYEALAKAGQSEDAAAALAKDTHEDGDDLKLTVAQVIAQARDLSPDLARDIPRDVERYVQLAEQIVRISGTDRAAAEALVPAFDDVFKVLEKSLEALGDSVEQHGVAEETAARTHAAMAGYVSLAAALLALVSVLGAVAWIILRFVRPIEFIRTGMAGRGVPETLSRVAQADAHNELGALGQAVISFKTDAVAADRIRLALDGCPAKIMVVDESHVVCYANRAARQLLEQHQADFRQAVPHFDPERVVGSPVTSFDLDPGRRNRIETCAHGTGVERLLVGRRSFDLAITPIHDATGPRLGAMLEWIDRTEEFASQEEVASVVRAAAAGDFSGRVPLAGKTGFLRDLAEAMNALGASVDDASRDFAEVMGAVAQGDLTRPVTKSYQGRFGALKDSLNEVIQQLSQTMRTIQSAAGDVDDTARRIRTGAQDLSLRTEQQAASLEETAATSEELAASVKASAAASRKAVDLAGQALQVASEGGRIVQDTVAAIGRIDDASRKITEISGVIDEIAFQTNLLALNAAVEAARAGEAGKGFAVVAAEVRTLAQRSSDAAKDITTLITAAGREVEEGVKLAQAAGASLERIVTSSRDVSGVVSDIAAAASEQASGIDEMSQAVAHMDEMTQKNAALADESAGSAQALGEQLEALNRIVATFRTEGSAPLRAAGTARQAQASPPPLRAGARR